MRRNETLAHIPHLRQYIKIFKQIFQFFDDKQTEISSLQFRLSVCIWQAIVLFACLCAIYAAVSFCQIRDLHQPGMNILEKYPIYFRCVEKKSLFYNFIIIFSPIKLLKTKILMKIFPNVFFYIFITFNYCESGTMTLDVLCVGLRCILIKILT